MKPSIRILLLCLFFAPILKAQNSKEPVEGVVSYVTSRNVYVKFKTTENIAEGDTLYIMIGGRKEAALRVSARSSFSCVCEPLTDRKFTSDDRIFFTNKREAAGNPETEKNPAPVNEPPVEKQASPADTLEKTTDTKKRNSEAIYGRVSVASYTNLTGASYGNSLRMRYNLLLNAKNIGGSAFSAESYVTFSHRNGRWGDIRENVFNGLKIYNLSVAYALGKTARIVAGRKINPKLSNMGAVDGLQFELKTRNFTTGLLAGSRPDYSNYGFNTKLFQYGAFLSHESTSTHGNLQTTLAFVEQKNSGVTDRRFAYLQHSNTLIPNLSFFGSTEFDLYRYKIVTDSLLPQSDTLKEINKAPELSNMYLSLRYKVSSRMSVSVSYSSRKNIIYYETYKSFIEQLLEKETQQGVLLQVNYRPLKLLAVGANGGYRFRKGDPAASKNLYVYATYSQIPYTGINATLSATLLGTSYLNGNVFALSLSRDLIRGKLSGGFTYRFADYTYTGNDYNQMQHSGEISLNWKVMKKLSCSFYYEGNYDSRYLLNRIFLQVSKSF
ncbi:MAG: hypothetical protein JNL22_14620 [Bacteroidales bacterium]|nr:hypothetical protein [Bacteroidales bacterium]